MPHCALGLSRRALLGAPLVAAALLAGALPSGRAHAMLSGCSSDPVVLLSNGVQLDLTASMQDSASDVRQVTFTLHGPVGTSVVLYTPDLLGPTSTFHYYADEPSGSYDTYTVASTKTPGVGVTAQTEFIGTTILNTNVTIDSASGLSGQPLHTHISL